MPDEDGVQTHDEAPTVEVWITNFPAVPEITPQTPAARASCCAPHIIGPLIYVAGNGGSGHFAPAGTLGAITEEHSNLFDKLEDHARGEAERFFKGIQMRRAAPFN